MLYKQSYCYYKCYCYKFFSQISYRIKQQQNHRKMSHYNKIMQCFQNVGYSQTTALSQYDMNKALDKISQGKQFDREVAQQLWEHTNKFQSNNVILRDFVQSLLQAQNVLKEHIRTTEEKLKGQYSSQDKQELQADLLSYVADHKTLTQPFNLPHVPQSRIISESKANLASSSRMTGYNKVGMAPGGLDQGWGRTSQIFATAPSQQKNSWSLKIILIMTVILLVCQMFVMFHKHHFLNIIGYTLILLIFLQNYFDKNYMRLTILWTAVSVLLDFVWLIIHSQNWWNPYAETQHSTVQTGYLRFSYFMVTITMLAKILVFILSLRYFNNDENIQKWVTIFTLSFKLNGKRKDNPFTCAILGKANINSNEPENQF